MNHVMGKKTIIFTEKNLILMALFQQRAKGAVRGTKATDD